MPLIIYIINDKSLTHYVHFIQPRIKRTSWKFIAVFLFLSQAWVVGSGTLHGDVEWKERWMKWKGIENKEHIFKCMWNVNEFKFDLLCFIICFAWCIFISLANANSAKYCYIFTYSCYSEELLCTCRAKYDYPHMHSIYLYTSKWGIFELRWVCVLLFLLFFVFVDRHTHTLMPRAIP